MTPGPVDERIVAERSELIREMLRRLRSLPLSDLAQFTMDQRNVAAAESYLRRTLEALLDIGRHVLARAFADAPSEYKGVATRLGERRVLTPEDSEVLVRMAGYRNRLVHFYQTVSDSELYEICTSRLEDVERVLEGIHRWIRERPDEGRGAPDA